MNEDRIIDSENHITQLWSNGGSGHYTKLEDMYEKFFERMLPSFKGGSVLEVGPGTGEFARRMFDKYDISKYTILDLEKNINDSRSLLENNNIKANYVMSKDYEVLFGVEKTLFVSNVCLPEVPSYYRVNLAENIFPKCEYVFIIGGNDFSDYNEWIKKTFNKFFKTVKIEETGYCGIFAISGEH